MLQSRLGFPQMYPPPFVILTCLHIYRYLRRCKRKDRVADQVYVGICHRSHSFFFSVYQLISLILKEARSVQKADLFASRGQCLLENHSSTCLEGLGRISTGTEVRRRLQAFYLPAETTSKFSFKCGLNLKQVSSFD